MALRLSLPPPEAIAQLIRFLLVGLVNTGFGLAIIWSAMRFLGAGPGLANLIGYALGLILSFALNRAYTFAHEGEVSRSFPRWLAVAGVAYLANLAVVLFAHHVLGVDAYLAQPLGIPAYTLISFLGGRHFVFAARPRLSLEAR